MNGISSAYNAEYIGRYDSEILCYRKEVIVVTCHKHIEGKNDLQMNFSFIVKLCLLYWRGLENKINVLELIIALESKQNAWSLFSYQNSFPS